MTGHSICAHRSLFVMGMGSGLTLGPSVAQARFLLPTDGMKIFTVINLFVRTRPTF